MGYELRAVIAGSALLAAEAHKLPHAVLIPLEQGVTMLPITDDFIDGATAGSPQDASGLRHRLGGFDAKLAAWSHAGPVAYVFADFFGGFGIQEAVVWADGELVLGPLRVSPREKFGSAGSPISQALRRLGVVARAGEDEFESVGLRRHRHTEDWVG